VVEALKVRQSRVPQFTIARELMFQPHLVFCRDERAHCSGYRTHQNYDDTYPDFDGARPALNRVSQI
jgi:hypothetical protein